MSTYLFIWTVLAGASSANGSAHYMTPNWQSGWQQAGIFDAPAACHKAAANLGLKSTEYRCLSKATGGAI